MSSNISNVYQWLVLILIRLSSRTSGGVNSLLTVEICPQICALPSGCLLPASIQAYKDVYCHHGIHPGLVTTPVEKPTFEQPSSNTTSELKTENDEELPVEQREALLRRQNSDVKRKLSLKHPGRPGRKRNMVVHNVTKTWKEALHVCQVEDGSLVKIDSKKKYRLFKRIKGKDAVWIGLSDVYRNNSWFWADGTPHIEPRHWGIGKPINRPGHDCGAATSFIMTGISWFDALCDQNHKFVCEY